MDIMHIKDGGPIKEVCPEASTDEAKDLVSDKLFAALSPIKSIRNRTTDLHLVDERFTY